jgi:hypothetical protein
MALTQYRMRRLDVNAAAESEAKKLRVTLVTAERLRWLQDLRGRVSAFYADAEELCGHFGTAVSGPGMVAWTKDVVRLKRSINEGGNNIILMLSPNDKDQKQLIEAVHQARNAANIVEGNPENAVQEVKTRMDASRSAAVEALTAVAGEAWRQVQALE